MNTYYTRPGNGCHLHYDFVGGQHRTLTHREAARLQSFPDSFRFVGTSQRAIAQQIGNAVPPLLAFQIALGLGDGGETIDLFAGAGGLSLGFEWAGWKSLSAVDIDANAVRTFNENIADVAIVGDVNSENTLSRVADVAASRRGAGRLALLGGPPCQGFSTGGRLRTLEDERNWLFGRYAEMVKIVRPDVLVFENVLGLLSMEGGAFIGRVMSSLRDVGYDLAVHRVNAADFGVPQRRNRVFIVGVPIGRKLPEFPTPWAFERADVHVRGHTSTEEALSDLPALKAGSDGTDLPYAMPPMSRYQTFMRGQISARDLLGSHSHANDPHRQLCAI